jgi:hypothetical protein
MKRLELIACEAVQEELIQGLEKVIPTIEYTLVPRIQGKGTRSRKDGSQVWPELNFLLVSYIEDADLAAAKAVISGVSEKFPNEGIFAAASSAERIK